MTLRAAAVPALALLCAAACTGTVGTVEVELLQAPGAATLDAIQHLRMTLTSPRQVVEADRTAGGFDLALDFDASDTAGALIVEGFDAGGALVACGQTPPFPVSAINSRVAVFLAAPTSIAVSPIALPTARSGVTGAALTYGAIYGGGLEAGGAASSAIAVYNAYDHTVLAGLPMPAARAGVTMASAANGRVYLFGGTDAVGAPTGTLWRFETSVSPNGVYATVATEPSYARANQLAVPVAAERYLITGAPALDFNGTTLVARPEAGDLLPIGARGTVDGAAFAAFQADTLVRYRDDAFTALAETRDAGAAAVGLPDGRVAFLGGATRDALIVDGNGATTPIAAVLSTVRLSPTVAATARHVLVIGGHDGDGAPIASADVLDATTLAPIATLPILPRTGGFAVALPNDQVLFGGGAPALTALELFTPPPP